MKTRVPDYFKKFECIADKCEDTCCAGWGIVVDDEMNAKYRAVKNEFGKVLNSKIIIDEDGDRVFSMNGRNCAFLNDNKLCDIYSHLGEDYLCYTCQMYPRFTEEFGSLREVGLSLSCPEAARIILNEEKITEFEVSEDDEMVDGYNDISYDIYIHLLHSRNTIMKIIQDRKMELKDRICLILNFTKEIQDKIDENKIDEIEKIRKKYLQDDYKKELILSFDKLKNKDKEKYTNMIKYFDVYINLDHIDEEYPKVLEHVSNSFHKSGENQNEYVDKYKEFDKYYVDKAYEYEHLLVYFIFRYFMKAVFDYDVSAKMKMAVVSFLIIKEIDIVRWIDNNYELTKKDQVDIMHMYSKDIEHSDENMESLYETFETDSIFAFEELMINILN